MNIFNSEKNSTRSVRCLIRNNTHIARQCKATHSEDYTEEELRQSLNLVLTYYPIVAEFQNDHKVQEVFNLKSSEFDVRGLDKLAEKCQVVDNGDEYRGWQAKKFYYNIGPKTDRYREI